MGLLVATAVQVDRVFSCWILLCGYLFASIAFTGWFIYFMKWMWKYLLSFATHFVVKSENVCKTEVAAFEVCCQKIAKFISCFDSVAMEKSTRFNLNRLWPLHLLRCFRFENNVYFGQIFSSLCAWHFSAFHCYQRFFYWDHLCDASEWRNNIEIIQ